MEQEFKEEKNREIEASEEKEVETELPGWGGDWAGDGKFLLLKLSQFFPRDCKENKERSY